MINNEHDINIENCVEIFKDCQPYINRINFIENFYHALSIEHSKNKDIDGVYMKYYRDFYIQNYQISLNKVRISLYELYTYNRRQYNELIDLIKDIRIVTPDNKNIPFILCVYDEKFKLLDKLNSDYISILKLNRNLIVKIEFELPNEIIRYVKIYYNLFTFSIPKVTKILEIDNYFSNSDTIC